MGGRVNQMYSIFFTGDKSEVLDIDNVDETRFPLFKKAHRYEVILEPGDVLFIPGKRLCNSEVLIRGSNVMI